MGKSYDRDEIKKRARQSGAKRNEKAGITLKEGDNTLRIGPTPAGKTSPAIYEEYQVHQNVGPKKQYLRCGHPVGWQKGDDDSEDYLCDEVIPKLKKKGKASRAEALAPQTRLVVQASVVTEDDEGESKFAAFKPWHPSGKTAGSVLTQILGSKSRDYVDPKRGYNFTINRTGTGFKETRYGSIEPDDESTRVPKALIAALQPFDEIRGVPKYNAKAQKAAYEGRDFDWSAKDGSESASDSESDSSEDESGVDGVFESSESESNSKKKRKKKMAVKSAKAGKSTKKAAAKDSESESSESESSASASSSASSSESESNESESSPKKKGKDKKKDKKKKASESSSGSESGSESESSESSSSESASAESESEEPKKKPAKKAAKKKATKK